MNDVTVLYKELKEFYTIKNNPNSTIEEQLKASERIGYYYGNYVNADDLLEFVFNDIICPCSPTAHAP